MNCETCIRILLEYINKLFLTIGLETQLCDTQRFEHKSDNWSTKV